MFFRVEDFYGLGFLGFRVLRHAHQGGKLSEWLRARAVLVFWLKPLASGCVGCHAAISGISSIIAGLRRCIEAFWLDVQLFLASAASLRVPGIVYRHFWLSVQLFLAPAASLQVSGVVQKHFGSMYTTEAPRVHPAGVSLKPHVKQTAAVHTCFSCMLVSFRKTHVSISISSVARVQRTALRIFKPFETFGQEETTRAVGVVGTGWSFPKMRGSG